MPPGTLVITMERTDRFYQMIRLLEARRLVPKDVFLAELEVSLATFKRDLAYLRDRLNAPIEFDSDAGGYRLAAPAPGVPRFQLPGLWFNADEAHALLTAYFLLDNIQPGLLGPHIEPLLKRIRAALGSDDHSWEEVSHRIRVLPQAARHMNSQYFELISTGVVMRKRLNITHYHRARDERTVREVSPQRLVHYRDNWYLDAWCHERKALRSFAVDSIEAVELLDKGAKAISDEELDAEFAGGYGIFGGQATQTARLKFTPESARWVANECWHPEQAGAFDESGHYVLELPYSKPRELVMDILRHGAEVEVLAPIELRELVCTELDGARAHYA